MAQTLKKPAAKQSGRRVLVKKISSRKKTVGAPRNDGAQDVSVLAAQYRIVVRPLTEAEGGGFLAYYPELKYCAGDGDTPEAALQDARLAFAAWMAAAKANGRHIPAPEALQRYSGNVPLRIKPAVHEAAAAKAKDAGMSLNSYLERIIAADVDNSR